MAKTRSTLSYSLVGNAKSVNANRSIRGHYYGTTPEMLTPQLWMLLRPFIYDRIGRTFRTFRLIGS